MAVADTAYSILDNPSSTNGGGGGATPGVSEISSDTLMVEETELPDGSKSVQINANITSDDGSVDIDFEENENGRRYDLSVKNATEERKGLLTKSGKYQIDHSLLIETEEQVEKANIAAGLLMNNDMEYYPTEGQMMTWRDTNGKLHLSRFEPNIAKNNGFGSFNWRTAVYDSVNDSIIVESKSGENTSPLAGQFVVTRTVNGGWTWTPYKDLTSPYENWGTGAYHNGTAVFISRNVSQEIEYTTDGGLTWTRTNLPIDSKWDSVWWDENGRWVFRVSEMPFNYTYATSDFNTWEDVKSDYPAGCRCCFLPETPSRYASPTKVSDWVCMCRESMFGLEQNVIYLKTANGWERFSSMGSDQVVTRHFPIKIQYEDANGVINKVDADLFVNDDNRAWNPILFINNSKAFSISCESSDWWVFPIRYSERENKIYAIVSNDKTIYKAEGNVPISGTGVALSKTESVIENTEAVNFIPYGAETESIFTFGGVKHNHDGFSMSNFNLFLTIRGTTVIATPPDFWREIPILDESASGIVYQDGNEVKTLGLGEFLEKDESGNNPVVKTIHSDRITEYSNYQMKNSSGIVWCPLNIPNMVDGSTKIYSDEQCTTEIGIVTNHSYNPHNPLDVEVSIGGVTAVYVFEESKMPKSLATTKAVIDATRNKMNNGGEMTQQAYNDIGSHDPNTIYVITD